MVLSTKAGVSKQQRVLATLSMPYGKEMIFRNNSKYLLVGKREDEPNGSRDWDFYTLSLHDSSSSHPKLKWFCKVPSFESRTEIGVTVILEIIDNYFWVMTSDITPNPEGLDPVNYYGGYRFTLDKPGGNPRYWRFHRRRQNEGPIHDHWTNLSLCRDERGQYIIAESRKEWLARLHESALRSFYTMSFEVESSAEYTFVAEDQALEVEIIRENLNQTKDDGDLSDDETEHVGTILKVLPDHLLAPWAHSQRFCHCEYQVAPAQAGPSPLLSHQTKTFSLANTPFRTYDTATGTFLEIVNDPEACDSATENSVNLHLRTGQDGSEIKLWPQQSSTCPVELQRLLQPRTLTSFRAVADERCVVFGSCTSKNSPIVLMSFDPSMDYGPKMKVQIGEASLAVASACYHSNQERAEADNNFWGEYKVSGKRQNTADGYAKSPGGIGSYRASVDDYPALWTEALVWWRSGPEYLDHL
ncbi:MAG: hypothetical protein LQ340_003959 [Diploschistes diacapsis]|nr:MAG: hypothetical protein LQ340_003959 [Diploschistes diacapsis]